MRASRSRTLVAALATTALVLAACSGDDDASPVPTSIVTDVELEPIEDDDADDEAETDDGDDMADDDTNEDDGDDPAPPPSTTTPPEKPEVELPAELPTELVVTDLVTGTGRAAEVGDTVIVDYVGVRSEDGEEFDNSYERGTPFDLVLGSGRVISGWEDGLVGVQAGGRRQLDIPAELAYGGTGSPPAIRPGDALTFLVDVRAVVAPVTALDAPQDLDLTASTDADALVIEELEAGEGDPLTDGAVAIAHVQLIRGDTLEVVYDTWEFADPVQIRIQDDGVLSGFIEGLRGMRVGGMRVMTMPPELAWGDEGNPGLEFPGDVDLIAVVELVGAY